MSKFHIERLVFTAMRKFCVVGMVLCLLVLLASAALAQDNTLNVLTYSSFAVSEDLVAKFEAENNVKIQFIESGDTPSVLNRAILTKDSPIADVIIGINNVLLSRALTNDVLEPYASPMLEAIDDSFKLDSENRALPFDFGDVCINYDVAWFAEKGLPVPQTLEELTDEKYQGQLVVENPASSAPGEAFLLLTVAEFGEDGFVDYWNRLIENKIEIVSDWSTAYFTNFTAGGGNGLQPMVVSYDASPAAAPMYSETPMEEAPTAAIVADGMCYRMVEFLGILNNTKNRAMAEKFVDAFLSVEWQEDLPGQMFVYPVRSDANLPEVFMKFAIPPANPAALESDYVEANYEKWIQTWNDEVLINY